MMNFIAALLGLIVFAGFDYYGYTQWSGEKDKILFKLPFGLTLSRYRLIQLGVQIAITIVLSITNGFAVSALPFILLWWTWNADLLYYLFAELLNSHGDRGGFKNELFANKVIWAAWTPYGIIARFLPGKKDVPIIGWDLLKQAAIGLMISLVISLL